MSCILSSAGNYGCCSQIPDALLAANKNPYEVRSVVITKEFVIVNFVDKETLPQKYKISYVQGNTIYCKGNTEISIKQLGRKKPKTIEYIHRRRKFVFFGVELQYIEATIIWQAFNDTQDEPERTNEPRSGWHNGMEAKITPHNGCFVVEYLNGGGLMVGDDSEFTYN